MKKLYVCLLYLLFLTSLLGLPCAEASTICVSGSSRLTRENQSAIENTFHARYPDVQILWQDISGDVKQAMLVQDGTVDIYFVSSRFGELQQLTKKGYYVDLSSSALLSERVALLHERWLPLVTDGTAICAYPWSVAMGPLCCWDDEVANTLGLTRPTDRITMSDLLAGERDVAALDDERYAFMHNGSNNPLIESAFDIYKYQMLATTGVLKYDTEAFRTLLKQLDAYTTEVDPEASGPVSVCSASGTLSGNDLENVQRYLPMTIDRADAPAIGAYLECLFINPYTANPEAALALMETMTAYQDEMEFAALSAAIEPILDSRYEEKIADYQQLIEQYRALIASDEQEQYREFYEGEMARCEQKIANQSRYLLTQEAIDDYQQKILPYVFLLGNSIYETYDIDMELFRTYDQYIYGLIDDDHFLEKMDNKLMMMAEEQQ